MTSVTQADLANAIRFLSMDAVEAAKSGHPGMPMGMADVATVLFRDFLKFDPTDPTWPDRDRFVLSAGHGSMLLYSLLHLTGYADMTLEQIRNFRQLGSITAGHPEYGHASGVETTTGPLGQGLATAVGMALAEKLLAARHGSELVDHHTYVIAGDGCLMEGLSQEAISFAGHLKLAKLIVLWDDNNISIDGKVGLSSSDDQIARFQASGWTTDAVDGHDQDAVHAAIARAKTSERPVLIACKTVIGFGAPKKQGTSATHGSPLGAEEVAATRAALGWSHPPFEIPEPIRTAWMAIGAKGAAVRKAWDAKLDATGKAAEFRASMQGDLGTDWKAGIAAHKAKLVTDAPSMATRTASGAALEVLVPAIPALIGGSADLTGSVNTRTKGMISVTPEDFAGRYIHYGIREFGMAAAMNGLTLHGGIVPYGGTFLVFSDYSRPAIRLAALMGIRVVHVLTHDSIGLGEDGPTHQPVEHVAALRAIPNLYVFRPADAVETAECWEIALDRKDGPAAMALTRQNLPTLRKDASENLSARGGYVLAEAEGGPRRATILATGSEVEIAMAARAALAAEGVPVAVVSLPCFELFAAQDVSYRDAVLGSAPRVGVEAAVAQGWEGLIGPGGAFIGMSGFGISAPYKQAYEHFGITSEAVAEAVRQRI